MNGNIESSDAFTQISRIKSANLPFLKGISLSNVEEIYWEKVQDKATKKEHYNYSVKYPFSRLEQRKLTAEFEALDAGQVARYEALEQKIGAIESADEISRAITELNTLSEYFFDDVRLSRVKGLTARYRQLYDALTLTGTFLKAESISASFCLDGNPIKVRQTQSYVQLRRSNQRPSCQRDVRHYVQCGRLSAGRRELPEHLTDSRRQAFAT